MQTTYSPPDGANHLTQRGTGLEKVSMRFMFPTSPQNLLNAWKQIHWWYRPETCESIDLRAPERWQLRCAVKFQKGITLKEKRVLPDDCKRQSRNRAKQFKTSY